MTEVFGRLYDTQINETNVIHGHGSPNPFHTFDPLRCSQIYEALEESLTTGYLLTHGSHARWYGDLLDALDAIKRIPVQVSATVVRLSDGEPMATRKAHKEKRDTDNGDTQ